MDELSTKATITYVEKKRIFMRYGAINGAVCSIRRLRLMRQHQLRNIFRIDQSYRIAEVYGKEPLHRTYVPAFLHPHDHWMRNRPELPSYQGSVVAVHNGQLDDKGVVPQRLLVELEPNVLAFADYQAGVCRVGDTVNFLFHRYNRKTKRIYGYIE